MAIMKQCYIHCASHAPVAVAGAGGAAAGADNTVSHIQAGPYTLEYRHEQACSDITPVRAIDDNSVDGWLVALDATDDEGFEMGFGVLPDANAMHCFNVGTDPAFFFEVQLGIPVVGDFDVLAVGFRTATSDYTDAINSAAGLYAAYSGATEHAFGINIDNGDYKAFKTTNGTDAQDDLSVTDAVNDDTPTIRIMVSAAGAVSASIDGTAVTLTNAGTAFDSGDIVVPYIVMAKDANGTDTHPIIHHIAFGYQ